METSRVYVYGIVHADRALPPELTGVGRPATAVRLLPVGDLAAVVSDVPDDLRPRRRDLMAHQDVLLRVGSETPVLPMRFGMVADDAVTVARAVDKAAVAHHEALERIGGRTEMNVKAMPAQDHVESLVRGDAGLRRLLADVRSHPSYEGNVRLGEAVAKGLARRAEAAVEEVLPELRSLADAFVHGPEVPGCVFNASFLVPEGRSERFRAVVERFTAARSDHVELRLTGPLPCYSFVTPEPLPAGRTGDPTRAERAAVAG
ncbi:GvpL/GvpF family gas vesicle protein [Streptomyces halstedii]|uniref:GvpL/GvpF family gas vesicle protein n=1 Tax=Streptomyces halstedii TaxID=1944 RepID=UPI003251C2D0